MCAVPISPMGALSSDREWREEMNAKIGCVAGEQLNLAQGVMDAGRPWQPSRSGLRPIHPLRGVFQEAAGNTLRIEASILRWDVENGG